MRTANTIAVLFALIVCCLKLQPANCDCPVLTSKKYTALDLVMEHHLDEDLVVAQVKTVKKVKDQIEIKKVWKKFNGKLKKKQKIKLSFEGECNALPKKGKKFWVFMKKTPEDTYTFLSAPEKKKPKEMKRVIKEVLCSKCKLEVPSFKKGTGTLEVVGWRNESLNLICKPKSVRPFPKFTWYVGDELLKDGGQVDITYAATKSILRINGGDLLSRSKYSCVATNHLGNATQLTTVIYKKSCLQSCDLDKPGVCRNQGQCCYDENKTTDGLPKAFYCQCTSKWEGNRCQTVVYKLPSHHDNEPIQGSATAVLGLAAAFLLIALLVTLTYFLCAPKDRSSSGPRRKQTYSVERGLGRSNDSPVQALLSRTKNGAKTVLVENATNTNRSSSSILNEIASSPRPSICSVNGGKRKRLNATAKGASGSPSRQHQTSAPTSPKSQSEPILSLTNGVEHRKHQKPSPGEAKRIPAATTTDDYDRISNSDASTSDSLRQLRAHDSDELVFSPLPEPTAESRSAAVVSSRRPRRSLEPNGVSPQPLLVRQPEIDEDDGEDDVIDEKRKLCSTSSSKPGSGERCISV